MDAYTRGPHVMNDMSILLGAVGIGLAGGGGLVAWDRWHAPVGATATADSEINARNPIAPALAGKLECSFPNAASRTCKALASYSGSAQFGYGSEGIMYLGPTPAGPATMRISASAHIKGDTICSFLDKKDLMQAKISVGGDTVAMDEAAFNQIAQAMEPMLGKEICQRYVAAGSGIVGKFTVNGRYDPALDTPIAWVAPTDGYHVGP